MLQILNIDLIASCLFNSPVCLTFCVCVFLLPVSMQCPKEVKMIYALSTVQPVSVTCWTTGQAWTSRRPLSTSEEVW